MSFEFKIKRNKSKNRPKFNRHEIWHKLGDIKKLSMHKNPLGYNMDVNDSYPSMWKDMYNFLNAHVGEPVNDVYSKWLKHLRSPKHYNDQLRTIFDNYVKSSNIHSLNYYIDNEGKLAKENTSVYSNYRRYSRYNQYWVNKQIPKFTKFTYGPMYIGEFLNKEGDLTKVWIISKRKWGYIQTKDQTLCWHPNKKWFEKLREFNIIDLPGLGTQTIFTRERTLIDPYTFKQIYTTRDYSRIDNFGPCWKQPSTRAIPMPSDIECYFITKQ